MATRTARAVTWAITGLVGLALALVCIAAWGFGLGRYGEDYCLTRATTEGAGFGGPSMSSPVMVSCTYGDTELATLDLLPLLWTLGWLAVLATGLTLLVVGVRRTHRASTGDPSEVR